MKTFKQFIAEDHFSSSEIKKMKEFYKEDDSVISMLCAYETMDKLDPFEAELLHRKLRTLAQSDGVI